MRIIRVCLLIAILILLPTTLFCQPVDSSSFCIFSRQSFYSYEKEGEFLIHIPAGLTKDYMSIILKVGEDTAAAWDGIPGKSILRIPFRIKLPPAVYKAEAVISKPGKNRIVYHAGTELIVLPYKSNEVKTDRFTGGLIVNKLPFFPFGFYCYSPVYPSLPEEEIVKGFNVISPYQKISPETLKERKAYMDRCAQLGMKVHYNLLSVSGGGGVGSKIDGLE